MRNAGLPIIWSSAADPPSLRLRAKKILRLLLELLDVRVLRKVRRENRCMMPRVSPSHSCRSATTGSTRSARRVGPYEAARAVTPSTIVTSVSVTGSTTLT